MAKLKDNIKKIIDNTPNNVFALSGDILIGAIPIFIKLILLFLKGDTIQIFNDCILFSMLLSIVSFIRFIAPVTGNTECKTNHYSEKVYFIVIVLFLYIFVGTLMLYIADYIGINNIGRILFLIAMLANIIFCMLCTLYKPECYHPCILEDKKLFDSNKGEINDRY